MPRTIRTLLPFIHPSSHLLSSSQAPVSRRGRLGAALITALWCAILCPLASFAQNVQNTQNTPDKALRSDAHVDPSTLGMSIQIPLQSYPGRGVSLPVTLNYSSKVWRHKYRNSTFNPTGSETGGGAWETTLDAKYGEHSASGWTSTLGIPTIEWPEVTDVYSYNGKSICLECRTPPWTIDSQFAWKVPRMYVYMPDGSSHELRQSTPSPYTGAVVRSGSFYSADGSRLRYNADAGILSLPDGSYYVLGEAIGQTATQYVDRNGNKLVYDYDPSLGRSVWKDTLNRTYDRPPLVNGVGDYQYSLPGVNGTPVTYTLRWRSLSQSLTVNQALPSTLFNSKLDPPATYVVQPSQPFDPPVLAEIVLPNNTSYHFTYNVYGEIDKIVYPTGGYERFQHGAIRTLTALGPPYEDANRGVTSRWVSADGGASEAQWQYTPGFEFVDGTSVYKVRVTAPDNSYTERLLYRSAYFTDPNNGANKFGFNDPRDGMPIEERAYDANNVMLRRKLTKWDVTTTNVYTYYNNITTTVPVRSDPRPIKEVEIIINLSDWSLAKTTFFGYDSDLNLTSTTESAFANTYLDTARTYGIDSIPQGPTLRTTETDYALRNNSSYRDRWLLSLPTETRVKNEAGTVVSRTTMNYDGSSLLTYGGVTGWIDPQTNARGNLTSTTRYADAAGSGGAVTTSVGFDQCGSAVSATDALGHTSSVSYSSTYAYAYPTSMTSAVPDPSGSTGSATAFTSSTAYDYSTGLVTSTTDANNQTTSFQYNDPLNRLKRVDRPSGGGWTTYDYGIYNNHFYTHTVTSQDASTNLQSYQYVDGLGRAVRSYQYDPSDGNVPWLTSSIQYDAMGRVWKVANPYRSTGESSDPNDPSIQWTTTQYDALGRVINVTTPDGATVGTQYGPDWVLVTDQAGKQRKSITDALGRLTQVVEAPNNGNFNYQTNYTYDALGNLRRVDQDQQHRYFMYDSLSRLIRAKNPEQVANGNLTVNDPVTNNTQWSLGYTYDNNGNLQTKTDARGITSTYVYDNLNRNTATYYSDGTPGFNPHYDDAGKGRLDYVYAPGANSAGGFSNYDAMNRPHSRWQSFWNGAYWTYYYVNYSYDLAGHVTSMSYPSGHTVNYSYDGAGRTQSFTGNLGDGVARNYATNIQYDAASRMTQEQYGTNTTLFHKQHYNVRGQLYDVRLSTLAWNTDQWDGDRGALVNYYDSSFAVHSPNSGADNNGNLLRSESYVPGGNYTQERYAYDLLNRLQSVSEFQNGATQSFAQTYAYDRFGNRTINSGQTWGTGINNQQFSVDANNNRLGVPAGQSGTMSYDNAGNLTTDTYSGGGNRIYDAENRMTQATDAYNTPLATYTYDGEGKRVRRNAQGQIVWMIYGAGGELLAEYASSGTAAPKEYGYRNGQLLITATPNNDAQAQSDMVVHLYQTILNRTPSPAEVQGWLNQGLTNVDAFKSVARQMFTSQEYLNRQRTDREFVYDCYKAYLYREPDQGGWDFWTSLVPSQGRDNVRENGFASSQEFADHVASTLTGETLWLTNDQLGTPRIINDASGSLANVKRHDYLPFGEELTWQGGRTGQQGYVGDSNPYKFAQLRRDGETGLDYAQARYYSSTQGRFTSVDPLSFAMPQNQSAYAYAGNNPLVFVDPSGRDYQVCGANGDQCRTMSDSAFSKFKKELEASGAVFKNGQILMLNGTDDNAQYTVVDTYVNDHNPLADAVIPELSRRNEHFGSNLLKLTVRSILVGLNPHAGLLLIASEEGSHGLFSGTITRNAALQQAKKANGIPTSKQPDREIKPNTPEGNAVRLRSGENIRMYEYTNNTGQKIWIREDGAAFYPKDGGSQGPHFNSGPGELINGEQELSNHHYWDVEPIEPEVP